MIDPALYTAHAEYHLGLHTGRNLPGSLKSREADSGGGEAHSSTELASAAAFAFGLEIAWTSLAGDRMSVNSLRVASACEKRM